MKHFYVLLLFFSLSLSLAHGQKDTGTHKIVFVVTKGQTHNLIVIPNLGKYYKFKIYRKTKGDNNFSFVEEKKKPAVPVRGRALSPYSIQWEDTDFLSFDVDYKVIAFDKNDREICEMKIEWVDQEAKKKSENEVSSTGPPLQD